MLIVVLCGEVQQMMLHEKNWLESFEILLSLQMNKAHISIENVTIKLGEVATEFHKQRACCVNSQVNTVL